MWGPSLSALMPVSLPSSCTNLVGLPGNHKKRPRFPSHDAASLNINYFSFDLRLARVVLMLSERHW